jgi:tRNA(Arg) A34 adenosine deaminase TadA
MKLPRFVLEMPDWVAAGGFTAGVIYATVEERMQLAVRLAGENIKHGGGPFGAAIFEMESGRLVAPGINLVQQSNCSVVHAEIVAIIMAQQLAENFDLGAEGLPDCELVSSTEPCAMCLGAIPWSGIRSLVCGARDGDAREIGFDEGEKPKNWIAALESRGISVTRDILRSEAKAIMQQYVDEGGIIYNGRGTSAIVE